MKQTNKTAILVINRERKEHEESVHEGKQFQCSHCQNKFTLEGDLRKHIDTTHLLKEKAASKDRKDQKIGYVSKRLIC